MEYIVGGCSGCTDEIIKNKTQQTLIHEQAKAYTLEKNKKTVVYCNGEGFAFCEEGDLPDIYKEKVVGIYTT